MIAFDTNILVYSVDVTEVPRHATSYRIISAAFAQQGALIPLLVLTQFYNVALRKLEISAARARLMVDAWRGSALVEPFNHQDMSAAMQAQAEHGLHVWDALIWATCDRIGVDVLVTEDLQDGRTLGRVTFLNPFNPANGRRLGLA